MTAHRRAYALSYGSGRPRCLQGWVVDKSTQRFDVPLDLGPALSQLDSRAQTHPYCPGPRLEGGCVHHLGSDLSHSTAAAGVGSKTSGEHGARTGNAGHRDVVRHRGTAMPVNGEPSIDHNGEGMEAPSIIASAGATQR